MKRTYEKPTLAKREPLRPAAELKAVVTICLTCD